jgi:hypothetical protein
MSYSNFQLRKPRLFFGSRAERGFQKITHTQSSAKRCMFKLVIEAFGGWDLLQIIELSH